jgi:hypothetical protein
MTFHELPMSMKTFSNIGTIFILMLTSVLASPSWAGRPLATEDAGVLDRGECEIESYAGRAKQGDSPSVSTLWAQFGCGIGLNSQLAVGTGREKSAGSRTRIAALTGKTFLRELTDNQTGFTLAYALFGAREPDDSFRHSASELKAVISAPHNGWLLHANLGLNHSQNPASYSTVWGLATERPGAIGPVDLMAEVFGDDRTAPWLQIAARWAVIPKRLYLDASWGVQTNSQHAKQVTVGLKIVF